MRVIHEKSPGERELEREESEQFHSQLKHVNEVDLILLRRSNAEAYISKLHYRLTKEENKNVTLNKELTTTLPPVQE